MFHGRIAKEFFLLSMLMLSLSACIQSRRGVGNVGATQEVWSAMDLCQNLRGARFQGCFRITLNVTDNMALVDVGSLPWTEGDFIPYRILARPHGATSFFVLMDNINLAAGSQLQVPAYGSENITDYEEWRVETTQILSPYNGIDYIPAAPGRGEPLAQGILIWPELAELENDPYSNVNY